MISCGAFANDARAVSDLFYKALKEFDYDGMKEKDMFHRIDFAVMDHSAGIIASVNHKGDSDSTGAVTGNILGALLGYEAIEEKWKKDLELSDVILEMADDLCHGCLMSEYSPCRDEDWEMKYIHLHCCERVSRRSSRRLRPGRMGAL